MIKKIMAIAMVVISTTSILTACSNEVASPKMYKVARSNGVDLKDIQNALRGKLPKDANIEENSMILDINSNGQLDCIVNFKLKKNKQPLRIIILSNENDEWVIKSEIKNVGQSFDNIFYEDVTGDGKLEIVAGFTAGQNVSKGISIYKYENEEIEEIFEDYYSEYILEDMNEDGIKEVILVKNEKEDKFIAELYKWQNNQFNKLKEAEVELDEDVIEKLR